jgi:hypothetical protein
MPSKFASHNAAASANRVTAVRSLLPPANVRFCNFCRRLLMAIVFVRPLASSWRVLPSKSRKYARARYRLGTLQVLGHQLGKVNTVGVDGHRGVPSSSDFERSS